MLHKLMKMLTDFTAALLMVLFMNCPLSGEMIIKEQVAGPATNCYLIYDSVSREAAIIDVAGPINILLSCVKANNLELKFFFFTHGHFDHTIGLPAIRNDFPRAKVCMCKRDYVDMQIFIEWALKHKEPAFIEAVRNDKEMKKLLQFDASTFPEPDINLEDNQCFEMGKFKLKTIFTPGHSPGSICLYINDILFSGDVLMCRALGSTVELHGSRKDLIQSVRKLFELLPDHVKIYPGHGKKTDMGSERVHHADILKDL